MMITRLGPPGRRLNITPGGLGVTEATLSAALIGAGLGAGPALAAVLLYRLASFWLVALTGWLILFWLRRPQARPGARSKSAERVAQDEETAAGADAETDPHAAGPGPHELVLLHGQPGSPADWQQVAARLPGPAPSRVEAVILLASVGPGCVNGWDRLLAAPGAGQLCALVAWRLTPWIARARLAWLGRRRGAALRPDEHVNWQVWGHAGGGRGRLWRTFLAEQRTLLRELGDLERAIGSVQAPVLLLADPRDTLVPIDTARRLAHALPDARLQLVHGVGHNLPRRAPDAVADAMTAFLAATEESARRSQARWLTSAAGKLPPPRRSARVS